MTTAEFQGWMDGVAGLHARRQEATAAINVMINSLQTLLAASFLTSEQRGSVEGELARFEQARKLIWNA